MVFVLILALSCTVLYNAASSKAFQSKTIKSLDDKKATVLELTASATAASTAISLIPGDVGTPIAEKLADLSGYFLIIFCAIYFEKYLFTISGLISFRILFPLALIIGIFYLWLRWPNFKRFATKLVAFGVILFALIPASMFASDYIEKAYQDSYNETIEAARESTSEVKENAAASSDSEAHDDAESSTSSSESSDWWNKLVGNVESSVTGAVNYATDKFDNLLSRFVDAIAVLIVTSCLIPIAILVIFIYVTRLIFGLSADINWTGLPKGSQVMKKMSGKRKHSGTDE